MNSMSTKTFVVLLTVCLFAHVANSGLIGNGEPSCQTQEEITVKKYRHFHNKTLYWECAALGQPAVLQNCPPAQGFLDTTKECVHFAFWYWTPFVPPPSAPATAAPSKA